MMRRRNAILVLMVTFCLIAVGCTNDDLVKTTDEKADIGIKNGAFDVTMDQCIEILNEDIQKAGLPLIPTKYESETVNVATEGVTEGPDDGEVYTIHSAKITDTIELQMRSFKRLGGGIPVIELINNSGKNSENDDAKLAKQYFSIICNNVEPKFDADRFDISFVSNSEYELGDFYFWCGKFNRDENEEQRLYLVTTDDDLFTFFM